LYGERWACKKSLLGTPAPDHSPGVVAPVCNWQQSAVIYTASVISVMMMILYTFASVVKIGICLSVYMFVCLSIKGIIFWTYSKLYRKNAGSDEQNAVKGNKQHEQSDHIFRIQCFGY
jgi:hypothetical protein